MGASDGGPAFPVSEEESRGKVSGVYGGMSIGDYFAIKATDKDVEAFMYDECNGTRIPVRSRVSARWAFAKAMIAARETKKS